MCIGAASICHNSAGFVGVYMQYANSYTAEFVSGQYEFVSVLLVCWCARAACEVSYCRFVGVLAQYVKSHTAEFVLGQYGFVSVLLVCRCVCTVCEVPYCRVCIGAVRVCLCTAGLSVCMHSA